MAKITINDLEFAYAKYYQPVFEHVNLIMDTDWKLGLIGRNGRGKTTFLRLLHGELQPDHGNISTPVSMELYPYSINTTFTKTIDVVKELIGGLKSKEVMMEQLLLSPTEENLQLYNKVLQEYIDLDGYQMENRIKIEIVSMCMSESILEQEYDSLSGGEKTRIQMIALFLRKNAFVLLDEPTNHLDIEGKETVASYLKQKKGFIVISHDRLFLDQVIDHVLSINKATIEIEQGSYSTWKDNMNKKELYEQRTKERLEREIDSLQRQAIDKRQWASVAEKTKNDHGKFERSSGSRAAQFMMHAKNAEQSIHSHIETKKELLKNLEIVPELHIRQELPHEECLIKVHHLSYGYDGSKELFHNLTFQIVTKDRLWIRGINGSGKSTLLKLLEGSIPSNEIERAEELTMSYSYQEPKYRLGDMRECIEANVNRDLFYELCRCFELSDSILKRPLETFSSGELRKVDIARALASENQVLFMDEPLNFMDVYFREQLEKAILICKPTLVFVEHDAAFGQHIATKVVSL